MSEINVSVGGGPGVVVSVAGDGTTATVTTGGTVNVTLTESNPTWGGIAGKPSTFPPQAHSHAISDVTGLQAALNQKVELDGNGKVPASQLPSFVDDVVEFANLAALPATGEAGKIYVTTGNGKIYRWSGTTYIEISAAPGSTDFVPEGTGNLYHTTARAAAAAPVQSVAGKTGAVSLVKADVGLGNVDNTTDASKPVSTAQAAADAAVASAAAADATSKAAAAQAAAVQRANHTGTQTASTISDFTAAVVAAAPPTTDASLLTTGTLSASRLPSTTVSAGSYGSASSVATFTVDAAGRLTAAGSTAIAISAAAVSGLASVATSGTYSSLSGIPSSFAPSAHTHGISDVTGLQTALDGKQASGSYAAAVHTHGISDVTGLQTALDGKAASSHTHTAAAITDFTAAVVAAAPPTTDASLLTTGTLSASRLPSTTVSAGSYGSASSVATFTVDAAGRLTAAGSTSIAIAAGAVSGLAAIATSGSASDLSAGTLAIARIPTPSIVNATRLADDNSVLTPKMMWSASLGLQVIDLAGLVRYNVGTAGGGVGAQGNVMWIGTTNSTQSGSSVALTSMFWNGNNVGTQPRIDWTRRIAFQFRPQFNLGGLSANGVLRALLGKSVTTAGTLAVRGIGIEWRSGNAVWLVAHDGTNLSQVNANTTGEGTYVCESDGAGNVLLYRNGTLIASTTGGPVNNAGAYWDYFDVEYSNTDSAYWQCYYNRYQLFLMGG